MKVVTWNVNGLRNLFAKYEESLRDLVTVHDPDLFIFQETRCPTDVKIPEWFATLYPCHEINAATSKKGYSGVGYFSKEPVKSCENNVVGCLAEEGRSQLITTKGGKHAILNLYVPNSKADLSRLPMRQNEWEPAVRAFAGDYSKAHPKTKLIVAGDLNVTPTDADLYRKPKKAEHCNTPEERAAFAELLSACKWVDTYRDLHGLEAKGYTWFSNFGGARAKGNGWRIDLVLAPKKAVKTIDILPHVGSDHMAQIFEL